MTLDEQIDRCSSNRIWHSWGLISGLAIYMASLIFLQNDKYFKQCTVAISSLCVWSGWSLVKNKNKLAFLLEQKKREEFQNSNTEEIQEPMPEKRNFGSCKMYQQNNQYLIENLHFPDLRFTFDNQIIACELKKNLNDLCDDQIMEMASSHNKRTEYINNFMRQQRTLLACRYLYFMK